MERIKIAFSALKTVVTFLIKVCIKLCFSGILMEVKKESLCLPKSNIFCTFNNKQNKQILYSVVEVNIICLQLMEKGILWRKLFPSPYAFVAKKQVQKRGQAGKKFFCIMVLTVDLPLAGNYGRKFLLALLCLTLPSYHTAVPGAYSTEIGWILPLSESEIKLNFNCSWAVFIMGLQPLQIYSETSKSSANLWARYVFHSHLNLLWSTSGASIANVSLDVGKRASWS